MNSIDLSQGGYTHDEVCKMLRRNRKVKYEYFIKHNDGHFWFELKTASGHVSFDSTREIMRTCSIEFPRKAIPKDMDISVEDLNESLLAIYFCMEAPNGLWLKYPLGVFVINVSERVEYSTHVIIDGYDLAQYVIDAKFDDTKVYAANTPYTTMAAALVGERYERYNIVQNADLKNSAVVEYEIGIYYLEAINDMLSAINYYPLYFDDYGIPNVEPYVFPEDRKVQLVYSMDDSSVIFNGYTSENNLYGIPNKFIRYTNDPDHDVLRSVYTVTDESIPTSTTSRGRVITDVSEVREVSSQSELDALTRRAAIDASKIYYTHEFDTICMPGHGFQTCILYDGIKCIETAWDMELSAGGIMHHKVTEALTI